MNTPTRKDYLAGRVTYAEYYRAVAKTAGVSYKGAAILPRVRIALANGDEHLNSIPLCMWDNLAASLLPSVGDAFRKHGDYLTLAGGVCLIKQAARDAATS